MRFLKKCAPVFALACAFALVGCGEDPTFEQSLGFSDGTVAQEDAPLLGREYDTSLFYRNDLTLREVADPGVIYVSEGEEAGKLFLYGTSNSLSVRGIGVWQSSDLVHWDRCSVAFDPSPQSWSYSNIWAPEVVYDAPSQTYYMTYSARNSNTIANGGKYYANTYIGLATASSPLGPFRQYTGTNANGDEIGLGDPVFDPAKITAVNGEPCEEGTYARYRFLDSSYFVDEDGQIYLYLSRGQDRYHILQDTDIDYEAINGTSELWVVKMKDFASPDYASCKQITKAGYNTVEGETENDIEAERAATERINEAPQMTRRGSSYYLTYSVGGTSSNLYSVAQAVGESPTGPFRKLSKEEGGLVLGTEMNWIQTAGTGHHCVTKIGNELFLFHHEGADRYTIDTNNRAIGYDRAGFLKNAAGQEVMVANGPTSYSLQALPQAFSGYRNIAPEAEVSASGLKEGSDKAHLTDGFFASHAYGAIGETEFNAGETATVTLTFEDYRKIRAIMLYNSIDYNKIFYQIARITLRVRTEGGAYGTVTVNNVTFPLDERTSYSSQELMFAGSNLVLDFNEIAVKSIEITFRAPRSEGVVAIGDIWDLGK